MADKNPTSPRLGDGYETGDAISGNRDRTSQELINQKVGKIGIYSDVTAGINAEGSAKGTMFGIDTGSLVFFKNDGTSVSIVS